jgi:hypothetical protein
MSDPVISPARAARIDRFLADAGWSEAARAPLAGDASFRRYLRLDRGGARAILMDAPPPNEDVRPFAAVAEMLMSLDLSPPRILARDEAAGLLLLEDLGDTTMARALDEGRADASALYALATDTLAALHRAWAARPAAIGDTLPPYDDARLVGREAMLLPDWYAPAVGIALDAAARADYVAAWREALTPAYGLPQTLVLRDYFPDNLMYLPERAGVRACGLLDFQDAVLGPCAYDLMSLLQDARRDVPEAIEETMLRRYLDARPDLDPAAFRAGYTVLAAQRHAKVIGIFTRLAHRDGKPGYLVHMPRLWRLMDRALSHPALAPVAVWFDRHMPARTRTIPGAEAAR